MRLISEEDEEILGPVDPNTVTKAVMFNAENPRYLGRMEQPDGAASVTGICEDTVAVQLRVKENQIVDAAFQMDGCGFTIACGNMACHLAIGKNLANGLSIDGAAIDQALGGLPREHRHCADLAANAMQSAVKDVLSNRRDPWKKCYGR